MYQKHWASVLLDVGKTERIIFAQHSGLEASQEAVTEYRMLITQILRKHGVVGKFVEFYGEGMGELSLADRATIANMSPDYGATMGFFPEAGAGARFLCLSKKERNFFSLPHDWVALKDMKADWHACLNNPIGFKRGLVTKKACELGLEVKPWVKASLAPGSGVVTKYLLHRFVFESLGKGQAANDFQV
ncbi:hypothetical protein Pint_07245 [Pistacia integerrima]|uniref:Uncharacterized protein n=1 Tax=Pistacia integerrima TaxID=434235 RepID=A0ACC0XT72_9ROSI|nr:hypothetical protein Pint_07245 [Pistacia integerrima]